MQNVPWEALVLDAAYVCCAGYLFVHYVLLIIFL